MGTVGNVILTLTIQCSPKLTHISQTLPQVAVDSVLVAVALQVLDDANFKGVWSQEVSQHIQNACSLQEKAKENYETC